MSDKAKQKGILDDDLNEYLKKDTKKRKLAVLVVALVMIVAAVVITFFTKGAGLNGSGTKGNANASAQGAKAADTITLGFDLAPTNLDIRTQSGSALDQVLIANVYEGLVARNEDNEVIPSLAKSWELSDDGLTYTFHLNQDMCFSNGDTLNAEDVVWSINELVTKDYHDAESLQNFKSIEALDDNTVAIHLSAPNSMFLWALTGRPGLVFDKDASYDAKTETLGSGPYTVSKFVQNDSITLVANDKYWGKNKAKTKKVVMRYFGDDSAGVNALKSGDIQVLAPVNANLVKQFQDDSQNYVVKTGEGTDKFILALNPLGKKTSDSRVRQAIRYAINHEELIASRGGFDKALGGPIPSLDPGYEDLSDLYPYDPDKARELLGELGYSKDNPLQLTLTYSNTYGTDLGDQLRSQLSEVGIDLKINLVEFSTWLSDVYTNHNYELSLVDHNESHDFAQWTNPDYYYGYDNSEVQKLYAEAIQATNEKESEKLLAKAARIVSEDAPADWLFNFRVTSVWRKGVEGFPTNMNQTFLPLYNVTYTPAS